MSSYEQSYSAGAKDGRDFAAIPDSFREEYPQLAAVFAGLARAEQNGGSVPAATVNLWFEGAVCKFCIMPRFGNRIAFGTIEEPEKGFAGLEEAIAGGRFEWKVSKRRNSA